jgi:CDP-paratose 2-epimerase
MAGLCVACVIVRPSTLDGMAKFLITGGAGFVGSHIAARLLRTNEPVTIIDNFSRLGSAENAAWLRQLAAENGSSITFFDLDVRNAERTDAVVRDMQPDAVFHLAGQVAMTTSIANPRADFETNVQGTINVLEAVRQNSPASVVVYASSNKVYGDLAQVPLVEMAARYAPASAALQAADESAPLAFHTPYGCSKGAADQYVLDYARSFGLRTTVLRHSTIYGGRQRATYDQGWVGWFCRQAVETARNPEREPFTISGDGKQVRDLLHVDDAVAAYMAAYTYADVARGEAFNIGGGPANSMSLLELFAWLERRLAITLRYTRLPWRMSDQRYFVANNTKATCVLGWSPTISLERGLEDVLDLEPHK